MGHVRATSKKGYFETEIPLLLSENSAAKKQVHRSGAVWSRGTLDSVRIAHGGITAHSCCATLRSACCPQSV